MAGGDLHELKKLTIDEFADDFVMNFFWLWKAYRSPGQSFDPGSEIQILPFNALSKLFGEQVFVLREQTFVGTLVVRTVKPKVEGF